MNFSVDRTAAVRAAGEYLSSRGVDARGYQQAVIFDTDQWADRYLQKTLKGGEDAFVKKHGFEVFYWVVRFFRPLSKEEHIVIISPATGATIKYLHLIDDTAARPAMGKDAARAAAEQFLRSSCGVSLDEYVFHEEKTKKFDRRTDYYFSWEKNGVYIPWSAGAGGAKILTSVKISGGDVLEFYKYRLDVPETFERYIQNQLVLGESLYSIYFLFYIAMVGWAVALFIRRKHSLIVILSKPWYIGMGFCFVGISAIMVFNDLQEVFYSYPTSSSLGSFLSLATVKLMTNSLFLAVMFVIPGIVGEALRQEIFPKNVFSSFQRYLRSTFASRAVAQSIVLGYLICCIMLGLQAALFYWGQNTLGVWREWIKMTQFSSAYVPCLSAMITALMASVAEEVVFRLFGITLFTKYFRRVVYAVIFTSFIWGIGHSQYAIFPVWFRGIEVGIMGCLYGFLFLRYGIIPLVVAHYLFDAFWGVAPHILAPSSPPLAAGAVGIMVLPLAAAAVAWVMNRDEKERDLMVYLDKIQRYNLEVLKIFVNTKAGAGMRAADIRRELIAHNWDSELVDRALGKKGGCAQ